MKALNNYLNELITEALLKTEEDIVAAMEKNKELKELHEFLVENYDPDESFYKTTHPDDLDKGPGQRRLIPRPVLKEEKIDLAKKIISCGAGRSRYKIKVKPTATKLLPDGWTFGTIGSDFDISDSSISDLSQAPTKISGQFYMNNCDKITSFEGNLTIVRGNLYCKDCKNLTSWAGKPEVGGKYVTTGSALPDPNAEAAPASEDPSDYPTLYDAIAPSIKNFGFKRSYGPSNYDDIVYLEKVIKRKYKFDQLKSVSGNKPESGMLVNIFAGIATQVKIDYNLSPKDRIDAAWDDFNKIYMDIVKKEKLDMSVIPHISFELDPVIKRYIRGTKSFSAKNGIGLTISSTYKSGNLNIEVLDSCILFKTFGLLSKALM